MRAGDHGTADAVGRPLRAGVETDVGRLTSLGTVVAVALGADRVGHARLGQAVV
jgi:hypothetical protein